MRRAHLAILAAVWMTLWPSCVIPGSTTNNDNTDVDGVDTTEEEDTLERVDPSVAAPGDSFASAPILQFDSVDRIVMTKSLEAPGDIHYFDLGPLGVGDFLDVRCVADVDDGLDPMIGLFDADQYRLLWNDDTNPNSNNFDASFVGNIRHDSDNHYLVVTNSQFNATAGEYRVTVELTRDVQVTQAAPQTVVLQWAGGEDVIIGDTDYGDMPVFDASNIDAALSEQTELIQDTILANVQSDYANFGVNIITSNDDTPEGNFSSVYFAASDDQDQLAVSEVDFLNTSDMDGAIVFLGSFSGVSEDAEIVARALSNVVSREIGKVVGLMLVDNPARIMHASDDLETLLDARSFGVAELVDFPVGEQNALILLEETVGL